MKQAAPDALGKGKGVEFAYRALRREIVTLTLRPGSALDEAVIATRLGLSRTPVHEALVRLAAESLVVLLPNRGASVAGMEWDQIREFIEAFDLEQRVTTRWAALRRTEAQLAAIEAERLVFERHEATGNTEEMNESNWRFHALIAAACGNRLIERSYLHVLTLSLRIAHLAYDPQCFASPAAYRAHMDDILREHTAIVGAISAQDGDAAEALGRSHAHLARKRIMDVLSRGASGTLDISLDPPV
jgi:DNA-binding GntR family transcriptional regulator